MKNFKELKIWQKGFQIAVKSLKHVSSFPKEERFEITQQIPKASVSISSNIAEGSRRNSEKDYHRYLEIAFGSAFELETQLLIAEAVDYGDRELCKEILSDVDEEQKMLMSFMSKLKNK